MVTCEQCGRAMVDAAMYDPDGVIPLYGGKRTEGRWWVCINTGCPEGQRNVQRPSGPYCPKLNVCPKVAMVLDKDLAGDWQYAEAIRSVCEACEEAPCLSTSS
jgi:hypothetical protein